MVLQERWLKVASPDVSLSGISARNADRAQEVIRELSAPVRYMTFDGLADECDLVVEALPPASFDSLARPVLENGKVLVALSASQLLGRGDLIELATRTGGRILVPSGAMLGLDAIKAVSQGTIRSITIETRKPVAGLVNAPYLQKTGLDLGGISEATCILAGSVAEIAREFPANVNVAAALSLAGIGPDRTRNGGLGGPVPEPQSAHGPGRLRQFRLYHADPEPPERGEPGHGPYHPPKRGGALEGPAGSLADRHLTPAKIRVRCL